MYVCMYVRMMHHIVFFPKKTVVGFPLPLRLLLDGLVAMLKAAMKARMRRGSENRAEVVNEGRCNGIDWSRKVKKGRQVEERRREGEKARFWQ